VARAIEKGEGVRFGILQVNTQSFKTSLAEYSLWDETAATIALDMSRLAAQIEMVGVRTPLRLQKGALGKAELVRSKEAQQRIASERLSQAVERIAKAVCESFGVGAHAELDYQADPEIPSRERFVVTIHCKGDPEEILSREADLKRILRVTLEHNLLNRISFTYCC
jgi:hypothetical protein